MAFQRFEWYEVSLDTMVEFIAGEAREVGVRQFAAESGVSKTAIYNLLNGKTRHPWLSTIWRVADAMGCKVELMHVGIAKPRSKPKRPVKQRRRTMAVR